MMNLIAFSEKFLEIFSYCELLDLCKRKRYRSEFIKFMKCYVYEICCVFLS